MVPAPPSPRLVVAPGVRAAQVWLLEELREDAARLRKEPRLCAQPLRVIVPGGALRESLVDALVRSQAGALVGVAVQSLWSAALEILDAAGTPARTGAHLFELVARRAVLAERELARGLGQLEDGAAIGAAAVSDLTSAGLLSAPPEQVAEALARLPRPERGPVEALVRAARSSAASLEHLARARHADVYAAAATALAQGPTLLPARGLIVYGFASATGQARALLEGLCARKEATWVAVRPGEATAALDLARRALGREPEALELESPPPATLQAFSAPGTEDELREVALRIRAALDAGAVPESIAVVARVLARRATALRRHFESAGVPFSGGSEPAGLAPASRRVAAALEVLREGPDVPADRWLDALGPATGGVREDLRCALRASGVLRLSDLARLGAVAWVADRVRVPLPQRGALPDDGSPSDRPRRRALETVHLRTAAERARETLAGLAEWSERSGEDPRRALVVRLGQQLELEGDAACASLWQRLVAALDEFAGLAPGPSRVEVARLGAQVLEDARPALGGAGGGVRVLDAQAARGAVFEHLFLVGLERGSFPRPARGDALLGEGVRASLREVLPELGTREHQEAEERWLFASLTDAAKHVTLSWRHADADGREIAPAPALERLLAERGVQATTLARSRREVFVQGPASARERAVASALVAPRTDLAAALGEAFAEAAERFGGSFLPAGATPAQLAQARCEILDELDPDRSTRAGRALGHLPGPWLGAAGAGALSVEHGLYVTGLESLARCPWQAFLQRSLGLEPAPDPLRDLPDIDALALGNAVHTTLQRVLDSGSSSGLERALHAAAQSTLEAAGVHLPGLVLALAQRARPYVENGLRLLAELPPAQASEHEGATPEGLRFRADVVCADAGGRVLIDFKTGKPLSEGKKPETRAKALRAALERGTALQAAAYAREDGALRGVYLYLAPDIAKDCARFEVERDDPALGEAFEAAVGVLADAWRSGSVPPRAEDTRGKPSDACKFCEVRQACLRDDSGNRARLRQVSRAAAIDGTEDVLAGRLGGLWSLGVTHTDGGEA